MTIVEARREAGHGEPPAFARIGGFRALQGQVASGLDLGFEAGVLLVEDAGVIGHDEGDHRLDIALQRRRPIARLLRLAGGRKRHGEDTGERERAKRQARPPCPAVILGLALKPRLARHASLHLPFHAGCEYSAPAVKAMLRGEKRAPSSGRRVLRKPDLVTAGRKSKTLLKEAENRRSFAERNNALRLQSAGRNRPVDHPNLIKRLVPRRGIISCLLPDVSTLMRLSHDVSFID
ncbi:hypothetical protein [Jiella marina]|uniref:hypothetical protein n=1 Tax=Jiella sp. LLJ827 TaxID=2917712 RepID=UPI002100B412|nr:hypothetical protein [Jiella sp. LLJ827]MCQ0987152.1 hypothetical protein [Jiella sp. LLJ827]